MAVDTKTDWSNPKLWIPLVIIIIGAVVGIPLFFSWRNTVAAKSKTANQLVTDAANAKVISAATGIDEGRVSVLQNNAHAIYTEMQSFIVDSGTVVQLLNQCTSDTEMKALNGFYNNNIVQNATTTLKSDVGKHVIDWTSPHSATDITYYNDLT